MSFSHLLKNMTATIVDATDRTDDQGHDTLIVSAKLSLRYDL